MSILPKNEIKEFIKNPKMFLIWGQSMSGKTFLARQFPNILILNTDGNGSKIPEPTLEIKSFEQFIDAIEEVEAGNHTFETICIDLIDDIATMMEDFICRKNSNEKNTYHSLAEIPFGKGFAERKAIWKALMMRLSQLKYNVIGISHIIETMDGDVKIQQPSLEQVYLNMFKGRCDAYIKCSKIGSAYIQKCEEKRDHYMLTDVKNEALHTALENVKGLFEDVDSKPKFVAIPTVIKKETVEVTTDTKDDVVETTDEVVTPVGKPSPKKMMVRKQERRNN